MEQMDLDDSRSYRSQSPQSPQASPPLSPFVFGDSKTDLSDMEVDPNSPPQPLMCRKRSVGSDKASLDVDSVKNSLDDFSFSLRNPAEYGSKQNRTTLFQSPYRACQSAPPLAFAKGVDKSSGTGTHQDVNENHQSLNDRPKTSLSVLSPLKQARKMAYGLNGVDDIMFSHYPNSTPKCKDDGKNALRSRVVKGLHASTNLQSSQNLASKSKQIKVQSSNNKQTSRKWLTMCFCFLILLFGVVLFVQVMVTSRICADEEFFQRQVLEVDLKSDLFGQHIASRMIKKYVSEYFDKLHHNLKSSTTQASKTGDIDTTCQPLVLSFHGWTGVGKNFASRIISQSFNRVNIRPFIIPLLFPHNGAQERYGRQIEEWIVSNVTQCSINLFIIDEMDKSFPAVQKGLLKSINWLTTTCSLSAPVIFLFISNTHASTINRVFFEKLNQPTVHSRLETKEEDYHSLFSSPQKEWYNIFATAGVVNAFVPFLPLERIHVIECIKRDLITKHFSTDSKVISKVLGELSFTLQGGLDLSTTGCKRVSDKVDYVMHNEM